MSIIRGLRFPTALAFGLLFTASIFWSLWSFTNVTFQLEGIPARPLIWRPTIIETPPEQKFQEEVVQKPRVDIAIPIEGITERVVDITPTILNIPVETGELGPVGPTFVADRDVMPLVRVNPVYPPRAAQQGIEGWVQVQFTITGTGSVKDVIVVDSNPPNVFDKASVEAVSRWRYNPKVEGAVAVDRVGVQTLLRFDLEEE